MSMVVPLNEGHCPEVARLHLDCLPTRFGGKPGMELLAAYYAALVRSEGGCGFVAEQAGRVAGYVCGVWEPDAVRGTLIEAQWPVLVLWGLAQVFARPRVFYDLVGRLGRSEGESESAELGYELRPIVVTPAARGSGIAVQLVDVLFEDALRRGFHRVYLLVDVDNAAADAFYRKVGFRVTARGNEPSGSLRRYERVLESS